MTRISSGTNTPWLAGCLLAFGGLSAPTHAGSFDEALAGGTANVDMRLRYENVDDSTHKDAQAATLRTRLGYRTGDYQGIFVFGEFEDVRTVLGLNHYAPVKSGYAVIADPSVTQVNQAFLGYQGFYQTTAKLGRQRLILDNARFVGNVGWRQNEQTFDAVSLSNRLFPQTTVTYAFLDKVNGILEKFDADVTDHLLNITYSGFKSVKITTYGYLLKDDHSKANNNTYGLRLSGAHRLDQKKKLLYTAEFASQKTDDNDALYTFLEGGMQYGGAKFKLGYERLGSDNGGYGLQTPLATKHAFNGWADEFLATPVKGLQDVMVSVGGTVAGAKLLAVYHDFSADQGSKDYGTEVDLLAARKFAKRYLLGIKYAGYRADSWKTDTDKLWFWGQLKI